MQPKGKTLITSKDAKAITAGKGAITPATVWDRLDKIMETFSPADVRTVRGHCEGIAGDMSVIYQKFDSIAAHMHAIRELVGSENFGKLANTVFPTFGLSRSKVYRMVDSSRTLMTAIPDVTIRQNLLGRSERPFTTTIQKGKDAGKVILVPAVEKALKALPVPAGLDASNVIAVDSYCTQLLSKVNELGKTPKKSDAKLQRERAGAITEAFTKYLDKYGPDAADLVVKACFVLIADKRKTIDGVPVKPSAPKAVSGKPPVAREVSTTPATPGTLKQEKAS